MSNIKWKKMLGWSEDEMDDLRFVGYSYLKQGHYDTALKIFRSLVLLEPNSAYDLQTLGALYLQTGNGLESLHFIDRSLQQDPSHFPTLLNRAKALFMLGHREEALRQTTSLEKCKDPKIAREASILLLAQRAL